jgi:glycosyltransferase involved in cell wall biosynthesis
VREKKIDIIYSNTSVTYVGIMVAILTGKPHIWHFHEPISKEYGWSKSINILYKIFLRYKKNLVIFTSKDQKAQWQKQIIRAFKNMLIYNCIRDIHVMDNKYLRDNVTFGYLGNHDTRKNVTLLISAFQELTHTYSSIKLLLGGVDKKNKIVYENSMPNAKSKIEMVGYVSDASSFYAQMDIFVLPSLSETWGLVVLEAMLAQKAVICTTHTGLHELFEDKKECLFIDPLNKSELLNAMQSLMNEKYRTDLAMRGYEKVKQYDFNSQFEKSFRLLLGGG